MNSQIVEESQPQLPLVKPSHGRDEMNFCEFCLGVLGKRPPKGVLSLDSEGSLVDSGKEVFWKLTIDGHPKYGLPTSYTERLFQACLQLTSANQFRRGKVYFVQERLLKLMKWGTRGDSYDRLENHFHVLAYTKYNMKNGWRNNGEKKFGSPGVFSIISDFKLYDRNDPNGAGRLSYFVWGDTLWSSIQAGYIKKLDLELLDSFRHAQTRRIFRYLDKHFWAPRRTVVTLRAKHFAKNVIGVASTDWNYLREKIFEPAIEELTGIGYLVPMAMTNKDRYRKLEGEKDYKIVFELNCSQHRKNALENVDVVRKAGDKDSSSRLEKLLVEAGVSAGKQHRTSAGRLACDYDASKIRRVVDYVEEFNRDNSRSKKGPGWIVQAIESENLASYVPTSFRSRDERAKEAKAFKRAASLNEARQEKETESEQLRKTRELESLIAFVDGLDEPTKVDLESAAIDATDNAFVVEGYEAEQAKGRFGPYHEMVWRNIRKGKVGKDCARRVPE